MLDTDDTGSEAILLRRDANHLIEGGTKYTSPVADIKHLGSRLENIRQQLEDV